MILIRSDMLDSENMKTTDLNDCAEKLNRLVGSLDATLTTLRRDYDAACSLLVALREATASACIVELNSRVKASQPTRRRPLRSWRVLSSLKTQLKNQMKKKIKTLKTRAFRVGSKVTWTSQSGAYWMVKKGVVCEVVPARACPVTLLRMPGGPRNVKSYVVKVWKTPRSKNPTYYWPVPSLLQPLKSLKGSIK